MDTMTTTKVAASLCGALLVFLLGSWAASGLFNVDGHGAQAYVIDTGDSDAATDEPEVNFEELYAAADIEKGARIFKKCYVLG